MVFSSVQYLSHAQLLVTPWTAAHQASLSITNSWSLLKLMSIESAMPSNHLILCHPLLFLPSIFPSIRVFSDGSALRIRWPKYWSFSFSISPFNEHSGPISFRMDWLDLLAAQGPSRVPEILWSISVTPATQRRVVDQHIKLTQELLPSLHPFLGAGESLLALPGEAGVHKAWQLC